MAEKLVRQEGFDVEIITMYNIETNIETDNEHYC